MFEEMNNADAHAMIEGSPEYPDLHGKVTFASVFGGTVVSVWLEGLPENQKGNFYGFHIHEGNSCTGDAAEPFRDTGNHFNPTNQEHPFHVGDMPVIMGNRGTTWMKFFTDRFYPEDVVGRTVVIHDMADDYTSQPAGNSGVKIACGVIVN